MRRLSLQQSISESTKKHTMNNDDSSLHSNSMNQQSDHESNNNEDGEKFDILFGKSCGSINHNAQMAYQNTINEFVNDKIAKNEMYLSSRVVRNEDEIKEIYDKVMSIDERFRWVNRTIINNNNGGPKYKFEVIDDMKTIHNKIFESIKRKKQYASSKDQDAQDFKKWKELKNKGKVQKKRKVTNTKLKSPPKKRNKMGGNQPGKYTYTKQVKKKKATNLKNKKSSSQAVSTRQTRSKTRIESVNQNYNNVYVPKVKKIKHLEDIHSDNDSNNSSEKETDVKEKKKTKTKPKGRFTKPNQNNKEDTESHSSVIFDEDNETNNVCATAIVDSDDEKHDKKSNHNNKKDVNNNEEDEKSFGGRTNSDSSISNQSNKEKNQKTDENPMKNTTENTNEKTDENPMKNSSKKITEKNDDNTLKNTSDKETENNNECNIDGKSNNDKNNVDPNKDNDESLFGSSSDSSSSGSNKSNKEESKKPHQNLMNNPMKKTMQTTEDNTLEKPIVNEIEHTTAITIEEDMNNKSDIPTTIICGEIFTTSSIVTNSVQESTNQPDGNKDKLETTASVNQSKDLDKITDESKLETNNDKDAISESNKDQNTGKQHIDTIEPNASSSKLNSTMDTENINVDDVNNEKECSGNAADKEANKSPGINKTDNDDKCKSASYTIDEEVSQKTSSKPYDPRRIPITHDFVNNYFVDNKQYKGIYSLTFREELTQAERDKVLSETHLRPREFFDNSTDPIPKFSFNEEENKYVIKKGWKVGALLKNLNRKEAGVPGDGNCAITSIIAHINDLYGTNYSVVGETMIKFRKWFAYNFMKTMLDPNIYDWGHRSEYRWMLINTVGLDCINQWYNEKQKDTVYYVKPDQDYIEEKYWIDGQALWPFVSWLFKKSIVIFNRQFKDEAETELYKVGIYTHIIYDKRHPRMFSFWQRDNAYRNDEGTHVLVDKDNTLYFCYEVGKHYEAYVCHKKTVDNISKCIENENIPKEILNQELTNVVEGSEYYIDDQEFHNMRTRYIEFISKFSSKPPMKKNKDNNDLTKNKEN